MSRCAREKSGSGYYHVMVRGVARQLIFEESADYERFISLIDRFRKSVKLEIVAYCLMDNHVHLIIHDAYDDMPTFMHKLCCSYALYFNRKYDRVGHVFQGRYLSKPIDNENYLVRAYRYVMRNPSEAGISSPFTYSWSSIDEYLDGDKITNVGILRELIGDRDQFIEWINSTEDDEVIAEGEGLVLEVRHDSDWALNVAKEAIGSNILTEVQHMDKAERNRVVNDLKRRGLSIRQIERITGISRGVIQRVVTAGTGTSVTHRQDPSV